MSDINDVSDRLITMRRSEFVDLIRTAVAEALDERGIHNKRWLTPEEFREYIGDSLRIRTIRQYVYEGRLPGRVTGNVVMVDREAFDNPGAVTHHRNIRRRSRKRDTKHDTKGAESAKTS